MSENTLDLQSLRFALTIVMGNDIVVPECDFTINPLDRYPRVDGYIWSYKGNHVRVDLSFVANATRMIMGQLDEGVEHTRLYVKHELYKLISKQRREGDAISIIYVNNPIPNLRKVERLLQVHLK